MGLDLMGWLGGVASGGWIPKLPGQNPPAPGQPQIQPSAPTPSQQTNPDLISKTISNIQQTYITEPIKKVSQDYNAFQNALERKLEANPARETLTNLVKSASSNDWLPKIEFPTPQQSKMVPPLETWERPFTAPRSNVSSLGSITATSNTISPLNPYTFNDGTKITLSLSQQKPQSALSPVEIDTIIKTQPRTTITKSEDWAQNLPMGIGGILSSLDPKQIGIQAPSAAEAINKAYPISSFKTTDSWSLSNTPSFYAKNIDNIKPPFISSNQYVPKNAPIETSLQRPFLTQIPESKIITPPKNNLYEQSRSTFAKTPLGAFLVGTPEEKIKANGGNQNMIVGGGADTIYPKANSKTLFEDPLGFPGKVLLSAWETRDTMSSPLGMVAGTTELKSAGLVSKVAMEGLESGLTPKVISKISPNIDDISNMGSKLFTKNEAYPSSKTGITFIKETLFNKPQHSIPEQVYNPKPAEIYIGRTLKKGLPKIEIADIGAPSRNYKLTENTPSLSSTNVPNLFQEKGSGLFNTLGKFGTKKPKHNVVKTNNKYSSGFIGAYERAKPKKKPVKKADNGYAYTDIYSGTVIGKRQKKVEKTKVKSIVSEKSWLDIAFGM